jgi:hypothetical protein
VSDDVRRAAVTNVGFLLSRQPAEVPTMLGQLTESYNAHVRYGAAMALGIACAATGLPDATADFSVPDQSAVAWRCLAKNATPPTGITLKTNPSLEAKYAPSECR